MFSNSKKIASSLQDIQAYDRQLKLHPDKPLVLQQKAKACQILFFTYQSENPLLYAQEISKYKKLALELFNKAITIEKNHAQYLIERAEYLTQIYDFDSAERDLENIKPLIPGLESIYSFSIPNGIDKIQKNISKIKKTIEDKKIVLKKIESADENALNKHYLMVDELVELAKLTFGKERAGFISNIFENMDEIAKETKNLDFLIKRCKLFILFRDDHDDYMKKAEYDLEEIKKISQESVVESQNKKIIDEIEASLEKFRSATNLTLVEAPKPRAIVQPQQTKLLEQKEITDSNMLVQKQKNYIQKLTVSVQSKIDGANDLLRDILSIKRMIADQWLQVNDIKDFYNNNSLSFYNRTIEEENKISSDEIANLNKTCNTLMLSVKSILKSLPAEISNTLSEVAKKDFELVKTSSDYSAHVSQLEIINENLCQYDQLYSQFNKLLQDAKEVFSVNDLRYKNCIKIHEEYSSLNKKSLTLSSNPAALEGRKKFGQFENQIERPVDGQNIKSDQTLYSNSQLRQ